MVRTGKHVNLLRTFCNVQRLALWVILSADDILKYVSYFSQKTGFDISCKLPSVETICMKYQILFSRNNKKNIISLSSAQLAQRVVTVKVHIYLFIYLPNSDSQLSYPLPISGQIQQATN